MIEKFYHQNFEKKSFLDIQKDLKEVDIEINVKKDEVFGLLKEFGLSDYESNVYYSLIFLGTSRAGKISKESNVPQSKIYEILQNLVYKQLVEVSEGRPKEYRAVTPEVAFKNFVFEKESSLKDMKTRANKISKILKPDDSQTFSGVWTIKGRKWTEFFNKAAEMLDRSEKYVYALTRSFRRSAFLAEAMKKCVERGVKLRLIGIEMPSQKTIYNVLWYKKMGVPIKIFETKIHPRIVVVDGREVLMRLDNDPTRREMFSFNSIWTRDPSFVKVMDNYLKGLWKNASPLKLGKTELLKNFKSP